MDDRKLDRHRTDCKWKTESAPCEKPVKIIHSQIGLDNSAIGEQEATDKNILS